MKLMFSINLSNNRTNFFHVNDGNYSIITSITRFTYSTERGLPVFAPFFTPFLKHKATSRVILVDSKRL